MSDFVCHVREGLDEETREEWRNACEELGFYGEHEKKRYCVLHFPGEEKKADFEKVLEDKLAQNDFHFGGTVFPENALQVHERAIHEDVIFSGATFVGRVRFFRVTFNGNIDFSRATFAGYTSFAESTFNNKTDFQEAQFRGEETSFRSARFSGEETLFFNAQFRSRWTNFEGAQFHRGKLTNFSSTQFISPENTYFTGARFNSEVTNFLEAEFKSPETNFARAQFSSERTYFSDTQFSGKRTIFSQARFNGQTDFHDATLMDATFKNTTFEHGADFTGVKFTGARKRTTDFRRATFGGEVYFREATFRANGEFNDYIDFYRTNFLDAVKFIGGVRSQGRELNPVFHPDGQVSFTRARIEKPELFSFDTVDLRSSWLVGVDARKFDFTDVKWYGMPGGLEGTFDEEIAALEKRGVESPQTLLAQACRRLSANAEDNHEYPLANEFHYWSMDALRKEGWTRLGLIGTLYWALSGYGVRAARALLVLLTIAGVFAVLYILFGPNALQVSSASNFEQAIEHVGQAAVYSMSTMARLNPEPKPDPGLFQFLVTVEGILGPLQIALLALAIRRKVMR
jgi:uncharacterized protein YjbI with pentapeptide repeats